MKCYICHAEGILDDNLFRCGVVHVNKGIITIKHGCGKPVCGRCYCNCRYRW